MSKLIFAALLLVMSATAFADQSHYHSWRKASEVKGKNAYGSDILVCTWECKSDYQNPHQTQTQGSSYCPRPN